MLIIRKEINIMASNKLMKYARGTVWWLAVSQNRDMCRSSVQSKQRPVVIVSNDDRGRSTVVEVCTITSKDKSNVCTDINIPYINTDGHTNYIECNQHFTVGVEELSRFLGVLPPDVMHTVNKGLLISQGMTHLLESESLIAHLKSQICRTQALLTDIESMQTLHLELSKTLDNVNSVLSGSLDRTERMENNLRANLECRSSKDKSLEQATAIPSKPAKKQRAKHRSTSSIEQIKEFLNAYENCASKKEFAEEHGYTIRSIYPRVSYLRKKLSRLQQNPSECKTDSNEGAG